jgi:DNA helicase-2/ATP-dependent DNA helicase PcrA
VQLAAYRLAWAALAGLPVEQVRAAFGYVREGLTVRPSDLLDEAGLVALVTALPAMDGDAMDSDAGDGDAMDSPAGD